MHYGLHKTDFKNGTKSLTKLIGKPLGYILITIKKSQTFHIAFNLPLSNLLELKFYLMTFLLHIFFTNDTSHTHQPVINAMKPALTSTG
jgi:hypothetical protein